MRYSPTNERDDTPYIKDGFGANNGNGEKLERTFSNSSTTKEKIDEAVKKGLVSIAELNAKFMRSNMYIILGLVVLYFLIGIAIYHNLIPDWTRFDCFYFLVITVLSIGYGDFSPDTPGEKIFTAFWIMIGIGVCSSAAGVVISFVMENNERLEKQKNMRAMLEMKDETEDEVREEMDALRGKNTDRRTLSNGTFLSGILMMAYGTTAEETKDEPKSPNMEDSFAVREGDEESGAYSPNPSLSRGVSLSRSRSRRSKSRGERSHRSSILDVAYSFAYRPPKKKTLQELKESAIKENDNAIKQMRWNTAQDFVLIFIILIIGMGAMMSLEDWSSSDGFYWAVVTMMTVGYGDVVPTTNEGRIFTCFYALIGCTCMAIVFTNFVKYPVQARVLRNENHVIHQFAEDMSPDLLNAIFNNDLFKYIPDLRRNSDEMTKAEFVLLVLTMMNKVEEKDILLAAKIFENLGSGDHTTKGYLNKTEIEEKMKEAKLREIQKQQELEREQQLRKKGSLQDVLKNLRNRVGSVNMPFGVGGNSNNAQARQNSNASNAGSPEGEKKEGLLSRAMASPIFQTTRKHIFGGEEKKESVISPMHVSSTDSNDNTKGGYVPPSISQSPPPQQLEAPTQPTFVPVTSLKTLKEKKAAEAAARAASITSEPTPQEEEVVQLKSIEELLQIKPSESAKSEIVSNPNTPKKVKSKAMIFFGELLDDEYARSNEPTLSVHAQEQLAIQLADPDAYHRATVAALLFDFIDQSGKGTSEFL